MLIPLRLKTLALGIIIFTFFLTGCSGGGGGSGSVSVNPSSLNFEVNYGDLPPPDQIVNVSYPDNTYYLLVGFPPGQEVDWLDGYMENDSTNPAKVAVSIWNTHLPAGTHTATLRFVAATIDERVLGYKDIKVTLTVHGELTVSPSSLNLLHVIGGQEASATLSLSDTAGGSNEWSASVNYTNGQDWLLLNGNAEASGNSLPATLDITAANDLAKGDYSATIVLSSDGKTLEVPVTYSVREPELVLDTSSLTFDTISGQQEIPASQAVNVSTETGIAIGYDISVVYDPVGGNWLNLPTNGTSGTDFAVQLSTTDLDPGTHSAQVTLSPNNGSAEKQFSVTYNVAKSELSAFPDNFSFTVDTATTSTNLTDTSVLNRTGGALSWNATPSVDWLSVSPSSGSTGDGETITLSFVVNELEPVDNAAHEASIEFSYSDAYGNQSTLSIPVNLNMQLPLFKAVTPYVAYNGRSEEVVLRGQGFDSLSGGNLLIGDSTLSDFTVVNDTEIRFNHPSLTAERYLIKADNALGLSRSGAELVIVDEPAYSYKAIPTTEATNKVLFDPERQALYAVKRAVNRIDRYTYAVGTGDWVSDSLAVTGPEDIALTADGTELIVLSSDTLHHVNPGTFEITKSVTDNPSGYYDYLDQLVFMNDGSGFMTIGYSWHDLWEYNAETDTFTGIPITIGGSIYNPRLAASLDRSVVLLGENGITGAELFRYDPETRELSSTGIVTPTSILSIDRLGTHFCVNTEVYDSDFSLLGELPQYSRTVCAPDGTRAYGYTSSDNTVRTFDLTQPDGSGGFVEIGTGIVLADDYTSSNTVAILGISQDGNTLFIAGDKNTIIQPLP